MKFEKEKAMDSDQLAMVAGGSINEVVVDFDHLRGLKLTDYNYDRLDTITNWDGVTKKLEEVWSKVGICCVTKPLGDNTYTYGNKSISRSEAFAIARNFANSKKN